MNFARLQMHQHGILKSDDLITRFFRLCTEMSIDLCYRALSDMSLNPSVARVRCFHTLDSFALLIVLLVKHSGDGQHATKVNLLQKVLENGLLLMFLGRISGFRFLVSLPARCCKTTRRFDVTNSINYPTIDCFSRCFWTWPRRTRCWNRSTLKSWRRFGEKSMNFSVFLHHLLKIIAKHCMWSNHATIPASPLPGWTLSVIGHSSAGCWSTRATRKPGPCTPSCWRTICGFWRRFCAMSNFRNRYFHKKKSV